MLKVLTVLFFCVPAIFAATQPSSAAAVSGDQELWLDDVSNRLDQGDNIEDMTLFDTGNANVDTCQSADCTTSFYDNGDGTYNTVTSDNYG